MEKRYNDFSELDLAMRQKHANMPAMPAKTWLPLKYDHDVEDRRLKLHNYLQEIVNRIDMRTNPIFRTFCMLDQYMSESVSYSPIKIAELADLQLGGRDFAMSFSQGLLFVAMSEMKIASRLDSYITNFTMPWEKKTEVQKTVYATVGAVACYKFKKNQDEDGLVFTKMAIKGYPVQTGCVFYDQDKEIVYVGFDDGKISRLKIKDMNFVELGDINMHKGRVTGILVYQNQVISISDAGTLNICSTQDVDANSTLLPNNPQLHALKSLIDLPSRSGYCFSDAIGNIHIHQYDTNELIIKLKGQSDSEIRGIFLQNNILVAGQKDGCINLFDIGIPGKEKLAKLVSSFQGKQGIRLIQMREKPRKEIITGDQTGTVQVWDLQASHPTFVLQAHSDIITQMTWVEDKQILITCGKDKLIKIWRFPEIWIDESKVVRSTADATRHEKQPETKPQQQNSESDDDLVGWDK